MSWEAFKIAIGFAFGFFIPLLIIWGINSYLKSIRRAKHRILDEFRKRKEVELRNEMDKDINSNDPNSELRL